jgi:hypothetical protein
MVASRSVRASEAPHAAGPNTPTTHVQRPARRAIEGAVTAGQMPGQLVVLLVLLLCRLALLRPAGCPCPF